MDNLEIIFDNFTDEASKGYIKTNLFIYNMHFQTVYGDDRYSGRQLCLRIRNKKKFLTLIGRYLLQLQKYRGLDFDYNSIKEAITLLFSNITYEEFLSPELYVEKYINFYNSHLQDQTISGFSSFNANVTFIRKNKKRKEEIDRLKEEDPNNKMACNMEREYNEGLTFSQNRNKEFWDSNIVITNKLQSPRQETPYSFEINFEKEIDGKKVAFYLPKISYGISNDVCYIYAVQNDAESNADIDSKKFCSMFNRALYELNDGVYESETQDYKDYKEGKSTEYAENISDVSPSAVLALSIFLNVLFTNNISKIKVVPFLPMRYNAKERANFKKTQFLSKRQELDFLKKVTLFKEKKIDHYMLQNNLTNKFIRNFMRLNYHFPNIDILNFPYEIDETMTIKLNEFTNTNNAILNEIIEKTGELKRDKNL